MNISSMQRAPNHHEPREAHKPDFAAEAYSRELVDEMAPLLDAHYREIAWLQDRIKLEPDYKRYQELYAVGKLRIFTARVAGRLVGYNVVIVSPHLHYKSLLVGVNDIFYVAPTRRGYTVGQALLRFGEARLKSIGVQVLSVHIKSSMDWGALARREGYELVDTIYLKWIGD